MRHSLIVPEAKVIYRLASLRLTRICRVIMLVIRRPVLQRRRKNQRRKTF